RFVVRLTRKQGRPGVEIQGYFDLRFEALRECFQELFEEGGQRGAAVCVMVGGETVVDLWAGSADNAGEQAWHSDTLVNLFSCTKTLTAVAAMQLVDEGKLQLDAPVARLWPEFGASGKQDITLRQLLSHQAGLPAIRQRSEEHTSELQSRENLVCRLLLDKKKN